METNIEMRAITEHISIGSGLFHSAMTGAAIPKILPTKFVTPKAVDARCMGNKIGVEI